MEKQLSVQEKLIAELIGSVSLYGIAKDNRNESGIRMFVLRIRRPFISAVAPIPRIIPANLSLHFEENELDRSVEEDSSATSQLSGMKVCSF